MVRGQVWTFEQPQKLSGTDVHINVRMTAVKLQSGGLLIYAPVAPTRQVVTSAEILEGQLSLPAFHGCQLRPNCLSTPGVGSTTGQRLSQ